VRALFVRSHPQCIVHRGRTGKPTHAQTCEAPRFAATEPRRFVPGRRFFTPAAA
jgi:hypothetical protein